MTHTEAKAILKAISGIDVKIDACLEKVSRAKNPGDAAYYQGMAVGMCEAMATIRHEIVQISK